MHIKKSSAYEPSGRANADGTQPHRPPGEPPLHSGEGVAGVVTAIEPPKQPEPVRGLVASFKARFARFREDSDGRNAHTQFMQAIERNIDDANHEASARNLPIVAKASLAAYRFETIAKSLKAKLADYTRLLEATPDASSWLHDAIRELNDTQERASRCAQEHTHTATQRAQLGCVDAADVEVLKLEHASFVVAVTRELESAANEATRLAVMLPGAAQALTADRYAALAAKLEERAAYYTRWMDEEFQRRALDGNTHPQSLPRLLLAELDELRDVLEARLRAGRRQTRPD